MEKKRVVIIGALALGPKVACRLKRLEPDTEVIMIDQNEHISYDSCGIPYFISGNLSEVKELMNTSFHVTRNAKFFEDGMDIGVRTRTRALAGDRPPKTVLIEDLTTRKVEDLAYDKLVLAMGGTPNRLSIPGAGLDRVMSITDLKSAMALKESLSKGQVGKALIIGANARGCEMAEALSDLWGIEVLIVESSDQVLPFILDRSLAAMVQKLLSEKDVTVHLN